MTRKDIHYVGFLTNADGSVAGLSMGEGFTIERTRGHDIKPFLRRIDKHYGLPTGSGYPPLGPCCVVGTGIAQFEGTPQGGVVIRPKVLNETHKFVQDKCRLLRLFKEGNIVLAYSFLYHLSDSDREPKPFAFGREHPIMDTTRFTLTPQEFSEAESFTQAVSLPLAEPSLHLAFESFELSYETHDLGLAFLSLMIGMEVMLNPSDRELRYRVSRNAAVLLGKDRAESEAIFKEMRDLYDKRSKLVHTGDRSLVTREAMLKLRGYARETIKGELKSDMSKDKLLKTLNASGFGERPWRPAS